MRGQEIGRELQHLSLSFAMRDMAAVCEDRHLRRTPYPAGNAAGKCQRSVLVPIAVYSQDGAFDPIKIRIETPRGELRRQPDLRPGVQDPPRLVAVPPRNPLELPGLAEVDLGRANARQRPGLDKCLSGFSNDRLTFLAQYGRNHQRHRTTHTVPEQGEAWDAERAPYRGKEGPSLLANEVNRRSFRAPGGFSKPESVVGHDRPRRGFCQRVGKITPLFDGSERVVQKDDRGAIAVTRAPATHKETPVCDLYERVKSLDTHNECVLAQGTRPADRLIRRTPFRPD